MNSWIDLLIATVLGGIARFEIEAFLKRKANQKLEKIQQTILLLQARQLSRLEEAADLLAAIHADIQKG